MYICVALYVPVADTAVNTNDKIIELFEGSFCVERISILTEPDSSEPVKLALVKPTLIAGNNYKCMIQLYSCTNIE